MAKFIYPICYQLLSPTTMASIQINIRISQSLSDELDEVCGALHIEKSDWIRINMAQKIFEERAKMLQEIKDIGQMMNSDLAQVLQKMRARQFK